MGANFSRHSSKGLSGRRCQSISNICNSKDHFLDPSARDREVDAAYKFCNSLPSPNGTVYNNNYEHKPLTKKTSLQHTVSEHNVIDPEQQSNECHPLQWKFTDTQTCDQGYGSERSPEEEAPPPIPAHEYECEHGHTIDFCYSNYPFILPENTFEVELIKGSRGLGLSVCGGRDSEGSWPGLLRIKRLFPHQPAAASGLLQVGDLLLEANGVALTGLSNYEALEVLRMTPNQVVLLVCRPPPEVLNTMSPVSEVPPPPPRRATTPTVCLSKLSEDIYETEFEIILNKVHGSLGFTLCKQEEGMIGHYVRALVREPAISDGRIQPGDKIVAVNGCDISHMNHEQAVQFLRQCDNEVLLRLRRELDRTPVDLSPTDTSPNSSFRPKPNLRQEAVDMLSDLAARKLCTNQTLSSSSSPPPCTSPKHYQHQQQHQHRQQLQHQQLQDANYESLYSDTDDDKAVRPCFLDLYNPNQTPVAVRKSKFNLTMANNAYELNNLDPEMLDAPNLNCSVYECDADGHAAGVGLHHLIAQHQQQQQQQQQYHHHHHHGNNNNNASGSNAAATATCGGLQTTASVSATATATIGQTTTHTQQQFHLHHHHHHHPPHYHHHHYHHRDDNNDYPEEPVSMPPISTTKSSGNFSHKRPTYQSADLSHISTSGGGGGGGGGVGSGSGSGNAATATSSGAGPSTSAVAIGSIAAAAAAAASSRSAAVAAAAERERGSTVTTSKSHPSMSTPSAAATSSKGYQTPGPGVTLSSSAAAAAERDAGGGSCDTIDLTGTDASGNNNSNNTCLEAAERDLIDSDAQILNIELNRGWNSRLGFSLQDVDGNTCVSAVYPDSVAAKDGRIKAGDCLIKVNDEMVENMKTSDVIDLLRIIRGPICITVLRRKK